MSYGRKIGTVKYVASVLDLCSRQTDSTIPQQHMLFIYNYQFCVTNILLILQEKVKPAQAPLTFNEEEKEEKEDLPDRTVKSSQVEDTLWCSEEPGAAPMSRGADVAGQQTKEKVRDFLKLI